MKLGKLLNASTSIFGGGEPLSYRLNKGGLPKFNAGRNPFATKAAETVTEAPTVQEVQRRAEPVSGAPEQKAAPSYVSNPVKERLLTSSPTSAQAAKPAGAEDNSMRRQAVAAPVATPAVAKPAKQGWATRLNPFRAPEPAQPTQVVQAELSLNSVKVVHNDLTDADVEVVPVKSHADAVAAPVLPPARRAWEYLGESLLNH